MDVCTIKKSLVKMKNKFVRLWKTDDSKIALLRDVFVAFFLVLILLMALWAYTGQWFSAPMVAIESGSMQHEPPKYSEEPYGRYGTINAGDMVLLVSINGREDIVPRGSETYGALAAKNPDYYYYGDYGDVIIYRPYGQDSRDQIIHRAICWVDIHTESNTTTYSVEAYDIDHEESISIPEMGLTNYKPSNEGFITMGDNNNACDQSQQTGDGVICTEPVKVEWISGKARCEIPWIGTINLFFNDLTSGTLGTSDSTVDNVQGDCIVCLVLLIIALISIPVGLDAYEYFKKEKDEIAKNNN